MAGPTQRPDPGALANVLRHAADVLERKMQIAVEIAKLRAEDAALDAEIRADWDVRVEQMRDNLLAMVQTVSPGPQPAPKPEPEVVTQESVAPQPESPVAGQPESEVPQRESGLKEGVRVEEAASVDRTVDPTSGGAQNSSGGS